MDKNKILIIEDEAAIRELLCMNLEAVGYETDTACDGIQAELKIEEDRGGYDLALVDVMLPGRDGFDLIGGLNKKEIPCIFLTAKADVASKVRGLRLGAEDYIVKPFEMMELFARVENVLKRRSKLKNTIEIDGCRIDLTGHKVFEEGQEIQLKLTKKLLLIISASLAGALLAVSILAIWQMRSQSISMAVDNYDRQMDSISYVFSEIGTREDFEAMGDIAAEAYLKYQFRKCYKDGYALLKGSESIVNLTDYEILAPDILKEPYLIQHLGKQAVLLMKREITQFPGYDVLMAQNITPYYQEIERRAAYLALLCTGVWLITVTAAFFLTHKALMPLNELTKAAVKIGNGNLSERAPVQSQDEIGEFAEVFNQMTEKVEKQVEDLQLLLGALAHEIKTPMTAVIGYSDSLLHVNLSGEQKERALKEIHHAGLRLERLSSKMLSFLGSYENDEIRFETIQVRELLQNALKDTKPIWEEKQIQIEWNVQDFPLRADRELFLSLLYNLIHNAVKASEPFKRLWIEADKEKNTIVIRDEGCGIPAKDLPHVTEAFYMADKSRSRSEGGSGLGLALCRKIASLHSVRLEIKSPCAPGKNTGGTEVTLHLPVYKTFTI